MEWRTIVKRQRRRARETRHKPVPHHPAESGKVEEPVAIPQIAMKLMLFHQLDQRAPCRMNDAFRRACRSGGIENIGGMGEGKPVEFDRLRLVRRRAPLARVSPWRRVANSAACHRDRRRSARLDARDLRDDFSDLVADGERLGAVVIAVAGDKDLGLDLPEPVENALHAEIGRSA